MWVRYFESQGQTRYVERPAGGWLAPIAGLMNLKYFIVTHHVPTVHPAAMVLVAIFLLSSLLLKKTFCSWLCPVAPSPSSVEARSQTFTANFTFPGGSTSLCSSEISTDAFSLHLISMSQGSERLPDCPLWHHRRRQMLNFFANMALLGCSRCDPHFALCLHPQLLVPVSMSVWCVDGIVSTLSPVKIRRDAEPASAAASATRPARPTCRWTGCCRFVRGVHQLHGVRHVCPRKTRYNSPAAAQAQQPR